METIRLHRVTQSKYIRRTAKGKRIEQKLREQLVEAQKMLILCSIDKIRDMSHTELKKHAKKSNVFCILSDGYIKDFTSSGGKTINDQNIISLEGSHYKNVISKNKLSLDPQFFIGLLDDIRTKLSPEFIKDEKQVNKKLLKIFYDTINLNDNGVVDETRLEIKKKIDNNEISESNDKIKRLRVLKQIACSLKFNEKLSNKAILKKLPLTMNQLKDAFKNYKGLDLNKIIVEQRGAHNKQNCIRTAENLEFIKNFIENSDKHLTVKEVQEHFQHNKLGFKCSKSVVHKIMTEDLGLKFGISKAEHENKNSERNKAYRCYSSCHIISALASDHLVISIDETGFSDYIEKNKLWHDATGKLKMKISKKRQSVTLSLLLAVTQNKVLYYYIVEGAVTAIIYLNFLKMMLWEFELHHTYRRITIIMDNARIHKAAMVKQFMTTTPRVKFIFTVAYSPELTI